MTVDSYTEPKKIKITCDQVANLDQAIYQLNQGRDNFSKARRLALLLEIMDILRLEFDGKGAAGNAISSWKYFDELRDVNIDPKEIKY